MIWLILMGCSVASRVEKADADLRAGNLASAEERYRAVLDRSPEQVDALYGLGWVYHLDGDPGRAREYFKRCVRIAPEDLRCIRGLGSVAMSEGNPVQARSYYDQALALDPNDARVLSSLGLLLLSQGDEEGALPHLLRAGQLEPERGEHSYNVAEAYFRKGQHQEALDAIDAGLAKGATELRFVGMMLELRALVLVRMTSGRVDPLACESTAPPVLSWLAAADADLDRAEAIGVELPNLAAARRQVHRRRSKVTEKCPQ
jgi:tetratricopeptide (TPR) repeat protein